MNYSFECQKPFKGYRSNIDNYFATGTRDEIFVFDNNLDELWRHKLTEIDGSISNNLTIPKIFYPTSYKSLIIRLDSSQLLSIDIKSGHLNWKQEGVGKLVTYEDEIYCLTAHSLKEFELKILDAKTGNVIRNKMVNNLDAEFGFRPTGHIKVYEEFIFCLSTQKPGMVCIFRRNTLEFYKIIVLEESIPNNLENVHWHKNKLYILTQDHTLHIFEKE